jgi:hypothetical protein
MCVDSQIDKAQDDGRECFERISRKSPTAEHYRYGFRKTVRVIIMFSEIRKTISSGNVQKRDLGVGIVSLTVNVTIPTPKSLF